MPARGLYARKNPPSLTNTTLADGKAARTRSPLRCFCHAHHSDHYRQHDFNGDILTLIKEAENYILKNIGIGMKLDGLVRVDVPEIDREAFHEAISTLFATATTGIRTMSAAPSSQTMLRYGIPAGSWIVSPRRLKTSKVSRRRNPHHRNLEP
jgi:ATP-dependent DNA helicase RecG